MKQYNRLLLAWLVSSYCCQLVLSFSVPNYHRRGGSIRGLTSLRVENNEDAELDRRRFLVTSVIGAASVLAVSENASAATDDETSNLVLASAAADVPAIDTKAIFNKAAKKALGGGKAGAAAAVVQVLTLMWLRTAMNYQYRYGGTLGSSLKELYDDGGVPRLYQGLPFAIVQGPLTRFGDTAANVGIIALLESIPETASLPLPLKTLAGSLTAGAWRICLMPIDTSKTAMQVEGADGLEKLKQQVIDIGPSPLYQGALASAAATAAGHFPWYLTYNFLNDYLPVISKQEDLLLFLVRSAALGLVSSSVSDTVSNSLRVIKTTKQTAGLGDGAGKEITYREALALVLETDGVAGLFGRGLQTRLLTNAIQGAVFSVLWKYFQTSL
mmetsp:Transcript_4718/g.6872  ORF Transcript_4718/g.6872 Transcript_4718/m.6872 type:complete len:385 (-) Transcript_4718:47-1201(-)